MRKTIALLFASLFCFVLSPLSLQASETETSTSTAAFVEAQITNAANVPQNNLQDGNTASGLALQEGEVLHIVPKQDAAALYIVWQNYPQDGHTLQQSDLSIEQNSGFLQEYFPISLKADIPLTFTLHSAGTPVEILLLSEGTPPENVHAWQAPVERADILLLPTHADDEHLFMGSIMPTYLDRGDITVQVAYMVNHSTEPYRQQELLNGLWEAGMRHYPIIPSFPDQFSDSLEHAKTIYNEQEIIDYIVALFEQFAPQVVVGHDLNGEYGHGAHMLYAESLLKALEETEFVPKKVYLHLYDENELMLEVNTPLAHFSSRTAFEVATDAFAHHNSQQVYFSVEQDGPYDLRKFGLAHTTVDTDSGNDMMENITPYAEQERLAQAAAASTASVQAAAAEQEDTQNLLPPQSFVDRPPQNTQNELIVHMILALSLVILLLGLFVIFFTRRKKNR